MWWKTLSVVLVLYALSVGLLIPLKPGVVRVAPEIATSGQSISLQILGYNSFYTKAEPGQIRVWLEYDSVRAIAAQQVKVLNDTTLEAAFQLPPYLPKGERSTLLTAIVDHPADGVSLLPNALKIVQDTALASAGTAAADSAWMRQPIANLHVIKDFSFPYRNVIYESIRNTYYHVPMWFVLMFLFMASVWNSIRYLGKQDPDYDRKAAGYAEAGLLFGFLGLFTGMVWANYAWGKPWSNDIKQLMTAVALLIYLAYFILRRSFDEPEKGARLAAVYNIFAFASLVPLLYIVPRMFASLHPGATGSPAFGSQDLDNTMRAVFYPAILGWTLLGFWIANLRIRYQRLLDKAQGLD
ncbi:MAG TPA: cytochrome c biogenesis protein CcsA [Saprospiraceae bacterium]|nr:cytochrome c biogenesis protein CcsA [Saprospiraceae bacterium]HNM27685.1 cytochrome c biogenesis protein CcsA [Saprospiraceae bacterium]